MNMNTTTTTTTTTTTAAAVTTTVYSWMSSLVGYGIVGVWAGGGILICSGIAAYQERKLWQPASLPKLTTFGCFKVVLFNILWCSCCLLGSTAIVVRAVVYTLPQQIFFVRSKALSSSTTGWWFRTRAIMADQAHYVAWWTATFIIRSLIGRVEIHGLEHLPPLVNVNLDADMDMDADADADCNGDNNGDGDTVPTNSSQKDETTNSQTTKTTTTKTKTTTKKKNTRLDPPTSTSSTTASSTTQPPPSTHDGHNNRNSRSRPASVSVRRHQVPAPVYIANHASQIDVAVVYYALSHERRFQWIAKQSIAYLPGVGQIALLAQNILIQRRKIISKTSTTTTTATTTPATNEPTQNNGTTATPRQSSTASSSSSRNSSHSPNSTTSTSTTKFMFQQAHHSLTQEGIPIMIFPQGTRWMAERLPFKEGAFRMAQTAHAPIVPLSIDIPPNAWNSWYPFSLLFFRNDNDNANANANTPVITLTIHAPIPFPNTNNNDNNNNSKKDEERQRIKEACRKVIYQAVPHIRQAEKERSKDD